MNPLNPSSVLQRVELSPLFVLEAAVDALQAIGMPGAERRVGPMTAGRFYGRRLSGQVLPGGSDWQTIAPDGSVHLDARIVLQTDAGELIGMSFTGIRHGLPEVMARLAAGKSVKPSEYYFRIQAGFSTGAERLAWLNRIIAVGTGHRLPGGPIYNLFEIT
ncbi:DUF3237 domain-containing protein [Rhizorhabdus argentea]|uniref:DUF3237 domain-containing protein n=1 Tax=Rhizorhabdus argentea TaxID=1387174 RepID=UPI0030EB3AD3